MNTAVDYEKQSESPARYRRNLRSLASSITQNEYRFVRAEKVLELPDERLPKIVPIDLPEFQTGSSMSSDDVRHALATQFGKWIITLDRMPGPIGRLLSKPAKRLSFIGNQTYWSPYPKLTTPDNIPLTSKEPPRQTLYRVWRKRCRGVE